MNLVFKRVILAAALVIVCMAILVATKSYGVWIITAIAIALFLMGVLFREKSPDKTAGDGDKIAKQPDESASLRRDDPGSL
jgi:low affinity Fe/Cu permease